MNVITVTQLNTYIKAIIDENPVLRTVYVVGEISNFKHYFKSGHMYFSLKDESCQLKAVMFSSYASRLKFSPDNGMRVICRGRVSVYDKDGQYQLYVEDMQPDGVGALHLAFEQLKEKLSKEGFFDQSHKKPIPKYPAKIGVATSNMGAAVEDIKNITKRRYPIAQLVIVPTIVQGDAAADDIAASVRFLDSLDDIDVIIVGRGGGSLEDLWAFNTETVARAVFQCNTPVISAVGHETDFTICDFVADLRAETPSAAAEKAVPDISTVYDFLVGAQDRMAALIKNRIENEFQRLDSIETDSVLGKIDDYFQSKYDVLECIDGELKDAFSDSISTKCHMLEKAVAKLDALSPLAVLSRGYLTAENSDKKFIRSVNDIKISDEILLNFADGGAKCSVSEVFKNGNDL